MSPNLRIAFRFLTAKKRAMLMSLSCTVLGVGLFIVTQATTSGFQELFIKTILGTDGAMRIEDKIQGTLRSIEAGGGSDFQMLQKEGRKYIEGVEEPRQLIKALADFPNVAGISPVLRGNVIVRSSFKNETGQIYGIELENHLNVSNLAGQITVGSLDEFRESPSGALIGRKMADRLQLTVGDSFIIEAQGQVRRLRVVGIHETGVSDIDKTRVYLHLSEARSLLKQPTRVTFLQLRLFDADRAVPDAKQIEDVLWHSATPWQIREKSWLGVFHALEVSTAITVSIFTLIASLAMFNTLAMIVLEKTKDIAILRSMGYEREDITRIFLWQAVIVLLIGTLIGSLVGAGMTYAVSLIPLGVTGIFKTETIIVTWNGWHYVQAVGTAFIMIMLASIIPARRAARLEPGDIVRGTAQ